MGVNKTLSLSIDIGVIVSLSKVIPFTLIIVLSFGDNGLLLTGIIVLDLKLSSVFLLFFGKNELTLDCIDDKFISSL